MTVKLDKHALFARALSLGIAALGLALGAGGARLLSLGGSAYYVVAGAALIASAVFLWRLSKWGARIYGALLAGTAIWAVSESGFDPWALAPRLALFAAIGLLLLLPWTRRALARGEPVKPLFAVSRRRSLEVAALIAAVVTLFLLLSGREEPSEAAVIHVATPAKGEADREWRHFGRTPAGTRYSPLTQVTPDNVEHLERAWSYQTSVEGGFQSTPLMIGDTLYFCTPKPNGVTALDAETGKVRWRFDAKLAEERTAVRACRGVSYHAGSQPGAECNEKVVTVSADAMLTAIDAHTGRACETFGANGRVDLHEDLGEVKPGYYAVTSPPLVAGQAIVVGSFISDNREVNEPSGVVRAFDAATGELAWAWDLGRADSSALKEGEIYTRGTPNAWGLFSYDAELGLVFVSTGNSTPDHFGAHRSAASEKYANSLVALDVKTGEAKWSYQTTHHDLWDYDNGAQPVLIDIGSGAARVPAVIQPTKQGEIFILDRRTGNPIANVEERAVPQGSVSGDWTSATQPFSAGMPSFSGPDLTESAMWGLTPLDQLWCRIAFKRARYEGKYTPPTLHGTIEYPGTAGGINWGSVAVDEDRAIMVVNSLHVASWVRLVPRHEVDDDIDSAQAGTPYGVRYSFFMSPLEVPCQQPPYGQLSAVDLNTRKLMWTRTIGTTNELGPFGTRTHVPLPMGVPLSAGSTVTRSGLVFIGGTRDRYLRAFDVTSGRELWRDYLPGTAQATPMTYVSAVSGRQFVVIATGGKSALIGGHEPRDGDEATLGTVVAYALPSAGTR